MIDRRIPKGLQVLDKGPVEVRNPYSGETVVLEPDAVAVYDGAKGAEALQDYDLLYECLDWFKEHEPKAYMTLLD
tara:strand:+ start:1680 stop:1904 length:225 start_codon:yes stop_codon:yes gene_type:complete